MSVFFRTIGVVSFLVLIGCEDQSFKSQDTNSKAQNPLSEISSERNDTTLKENNTAPSTQTAPCVPTDQDLCLWGNRFRVKAQFLNPSTNQLTNAKAMQNKKESGHFYFFSPENVEITVKIINGYGYNQKAWIFYGGITSLEYNLTVEDTLTGEVKTYHTEALNGTNAVCGIQDISALPLSQPISNAPEFSPHPALSHQSQENSDCQYSPSKHCLLDDRFEVKVDYIHQNITRNAVALPRRTNNTGFFSFFEEGNIELMLKVLDGRGHNGHFWMFYGSLTNLGYNIHVTDTVSGEEVEYSNPPGQPCGLLDIKMMAENNNPPPPSEECPPGATCFKESGVFHSPTPSNKVKRLSYQVPSGDYTYVKAELDVRISQWANNNNKGAHNIFWFVKNRNFDMLGYVNVNGPSKNRIFNRHGFQQTQGDKARMSTGLALQENSEYHFTYIYDTTNNNIELIVEDSNGTEVAHLYGQPNVPSISMNASDKFVLDFGFAGINPNEPPTYGWKYKNLSLVFD